MSAVCHFLRHKVVFITGATGFVGKALVEKILRHVPEVGQVYLLIRPKRGPHGTALSAADRLRCDVINSSVFVRLRAQYGTAFEGFVSSKLVAVGGNLNADRLGIERDLYEQLCQHVQVVINCAATVDFVEPLNHALQSNTLGVKRLLAFVKACPGALLVHVSTAYVSGQRIGLIAEEALSPDRTIAQIMGQTGSPYDLEEEITDIMRFAQQVEAQSQCPEKQSYFRRAALKHNGRRASPQRLQSHAEAMRKRWVERRLVEEGRSRAKRLGWHDSYTLTKAMGEQVIVKYRGQVATAIIRPSIIESSLGEPEPGWIDGLKVADPLISAYAKGRLLDLPANPDSVIDLVPVDFVVNTILACLPCLSQEQGLHVYHVATGSENPLQIRKLYDLIRDYFTRNPLLNKQGDPIAVNHWNFPQLQKFRRRYQFRYLLPLAGLEWVAERLSMVPSMTRLKRRTSIRKATYNQALHYAEIYSPYTKLDCQFETSNLRRLFASQDAEDQRLFNVRVSQISWPDYIQNIHIPGLKRHVLKLDSEDSKAAPEVGQADAVTVPEGPGFNQRQPQTAASRVREGDKPVQVPVTISELLARSAARYGTKVVMQNKRNGQWQRIRYGQLHDSAGRMGALWRRFGLRRGDRVLLCAENAPAWGIAYMAAMAVGATVVPTDRQTREDEILDIARFTEARAMLCSEECLASFSQGLVADLNQGDAWLPLWNIDNHGLPFSEPKTAVPPPLPEEEIFWEEVTPDDLASIIFTSGMIVDPRGVMLSHRNIMTDLMALAKVLRAYETDQFLSVLPLHHALEFTGGFLMPIYGGATITYVDTLRSRIVLEMMKETGTTGLLAVPRIFKLLYDRIQRQGGSLGPDGGLSVARTLGEEHGWDEEEEDTAPGHSQGDSGKVTALGSQIRLLVSGAAALDGALYEAYRRLGLTIYEGYGMTETAPILTVNPLGKSKKNSVGPPLPGVELRIVPLSPEQSRGMLRLKPVPGDYQEGEIVVRGPNVMAGYYQNPQANAKMIRDGWLFTGDVGYLDEEGYLYITGRVKDLIVTGAGKNVYPEEVEALYKEVPYVKAFQVVGMPAAHGSGEEVHAVIVPDQEAFSKPEDSEALQQAIIEAIHQISRELPTYQRIQQVHLWHESLPQDPDLRVVRKQLRQKLGARLKADKPAREASVGPAQQTGRSWEQEVYTILNQLTNLSVAELAANRSKPLDTLMDSLMKVELLAALETRFEVSIPDEAALQFTTITDVLTGVKTYLEQSKKGVDDQAVQQTGPIDTSSYWAKVLAEEKRVAPGEGGRLRRAAQNLFWIGGRLVYRHWFSLTYEGLENLPQDGPYLIAANHASHLDWGAALMALWGQVERLNILIAQDYFFNTPLKAWLIRKVLNGPFVNFIPFDRYGNFLEGMRASRQVLRPRHPVLIFPEGTRSVSGTLQPFKAGLGPLALELNVPVVPVYIQGTYQALPKGRSWPHRYPLRVLIGQPLTMAPYQAKKGTVMNYDIYRQIVEDVRNAVVQLRDRRSDQSAEKVS